MEAEPLANTFVLCIELTDAVLLDLLNYSYSGMHSHTYLSALEEALKSIFGSSYSYSQICELYRISRTETVHGDHQTYMTVQFDKVGVHYQRLP